MKDNVGKVIQKYCDRYDTEGRLLLIINNKGIEFGDLKLSKILKEDFDTNNISYNEVKSIENIYDSFTLSYGDNHLPYVNLNIKQETGREPSWDEYNDDYDDGLECIVDVNYPEDIYHYNDFEEDDRIYPIDNIHDMSEWEKNILSKKQQSLYLYINYYPNNKPIESFEYGSISKYKESIFYNCEKYTEKINWFLEWLGVESRLEFKPTKQKETNNNSTIQELKGCYSEVLNSFNTKNKGFNNLIKDSIGKYTKDIYFHMNAKNAYGQDRAKDEYSCGIRAIVEGYNMNINSVNKDDFKSKLPIDFICHYLEWKGATSLALYNREELNGLSYRDVVPQNKYSYDKLNDLMSEYFGEAIVGDDNFFYNNYYEFEMLLDSGEDCIRIEKNWICIMFIDEDNKVIGRLGGLDNRDRYRYDYSKLVKSFNKLKKDIKGE